MAAMWILSSCVWGNSCWHHCQYSPKWTGAHLPTIQEISPDLSASGDPLSQSRALKGMYFPKFLLMLQSLTCLWANEDICKFLQTCDLVFFFFFSACHMYSVALPEVFQVSTGGISLIWDQTSTVKLKSGSFALVRFCSDFRCWS